jgi:predicted phosphodiesterase
VKAKWIVGLALLSLLAPSQPEPPLQTGAYVQDVTQHGAKVCWVGVRDQVEVRVTGGSGAAPAVQQRRIGERTLVEVSGLAPATRYEFVGSIAGQPVPSLSGSFVTAPASAAAAVRFAVVGDSGGLPWWVNLSRSPLVGALARADLLPADANPTSVGKLLAGMRPEFWLHTGDVIYPRGEHRHYGPGFFAPFADVLRQAPVYAVLGNHDWDWELGRALLGNFELPSDDLGGDEQFFTFAWGPVRVVGLNLNKSIGLEPGLAYLERALAQATEPWRIVVEHFPPWSASNQGDRPDLIEGLVPRLQALRVDLLLCGHDHVYQRFQPVGDLHIVCTGGGGKSLYELKPHPRVVKAEAVYHACSVEADAARLTLRALTVEQREVDVLALAKKPR